MRTDKRIFKTRSSIKKAFMELVENREMSKISISDIAAKALINRSTFYLHYNDITEIAADIEKEIAERISYYIDEFSISNIYDSTLTLFRRLTKRLEENPDMKRYIFFSTNSDYVAARLKLIFVEKTKKKILHRFPLLREKDIIYRLTYAAAGIIDSYMKWIRAADSSTTLDELIKTTSEITERIIAAIARENS